MGLTNQWRTTVKNELKIVVPFLIISIFLNCISLFRVNLQINNGFSAFAQSFVYDADIMMLSSYANASNLGYIYMPFILSIFQFCAIPNGFLFSLPVKKREIFFTKYFCGVLSYTLSLVVFFVGMLIIATYNRGYILDWFAFLPSDLYKMVLFDNSNSSLLFQAFAAWLSMSIAYVFGVVVGLCVRNRLAAAILGLFSISCITVFYGILLRLTYTWQLSIPINEIFQYINPFADIVSHNRIIFSPPHDATLLEKAMTPLLTVPVSSRIFFPVLLKVSINIYIIILLTSLAIKLYSHPYTVERQSLFVFPAAASVFKFSCAATGGVILFQLSFSSNSSPLIFLSFIVGSVLGYFAGSLIVHFTDSHVERRKKLWRKS